MLLLQFASGVDDEPPTPIAGVGGSDWVYADRAYASSSAKAFSPALRPKASVARMPVPVPG